MPTWRRRSLEAKDLEHLLHPATNLKAHHERPDSDDAREGVYLGWQGKQYLQGMAGLWCTAIGYGEGTRALQRTMEAELLHLFGGKSNSRAFCWPKLKAMMPFEQDACSSVSGSDASDTQIKLMLVPQLSVNRARRSSRGVAAITE
jgi:4-aminobutyrate--pyruvate transaminase